jgi:ribosomal protein S27E
MISKELQIRPFEVDSHTARVGRSSFVAVCPFCAARSIIYTWSFAGIGKKTCPCGAIFRRRNGGESEKLVEVARTSDTETT